ncbi:hypothetical protein [Aequorivita capsosiphonis]|uniref:hypothetical protein n=1 Tax=Aequorivita capsosiphonis TaxID=487317 RepID=UPI00146FC70D|nr:hypothetical protein [Aequorivita capsosiphonis]
MKNHLLILGIFLLFISCKMKPQENQIDTKEYHEPYNHHGSENYGISTIFSKEFETLKLYLNKENNEIIVPGKTNPADKQNSQSKRLKVSAFGVIMEHGLTNAGALSDGTLKGFDFYSNWIINGDTTKYKYTDAFTNNKVNDPYEYKNSETNFEKWKKKFEELYQKASYVYRDGSFYYLKGENNEWFFMKAKFAEKPEDFPKQYPAKEDQDVRMLELKDQFPDLYLPPAERDTILIKQVKYISKFFEKSDRGDAFNYSAGWWYFDLYMPGGDTLKIKRFASFRDPEMKL